MAISLTGWLEDAIATQLLLGNNWLEHKNRQKKSDIRSDPARAWRGLYHDNGSCLDITNDIHPERNSNLQIIQLSPLVLTDGRTQVLGYLSPGCLPSLKPPPISILHAVIAVRRYTIRYTHYGPPRDQIRFILHTIDWLGLYQEGDHKPISKPFAPLWSEEICRTVEQLRNTRASEDRRCLGSGVGAEEETPEIVIGMAATDNASQGASQPNTQHAFGTQMTHPLPARPSEDGLQLLGVKRLEPVLAGNTQREELRPKITPAGLLSLLKQTNHPNAHKPTNVPADNIVRAAISKPRRVAEPPGTQLLTQLPVLVDRRPTQTPSTSTEAIPISPPPTGTTKRTREFGVVSPKVGQNIAEQVGVAGAIEESEDNKLQKLALECPWMKDLEFSREALKVPYNQLSILQKDDSWHKPQPGNRFPDGNVPITILTTLHRLADENAAMEAGPDSNDEMDEDPSPEFPVENVHPSPEGALQATPDDHLPTSQVSWSASPSPEPPKVPTRLDQALPPDSSFETAEAAIDISAERVTAPSQPSHSIVIDSSNDKEENALPSSPPVNEEPMVFDDEMEMEECVPQGLGEDSMQGASKIQEHHVSVSPPPRPLVQVKETPYIKNKNGQHGKHTASSPPQTQHSNGVFKNTSSTSIVYGTYDGKTSSKVTDKPSHPDTGVVAATGREERESAQTKEQYDLETRKSSKRTLKDKVLGVTGHNIAIPEALAVSPRQEQAELEDQPTRNAVSQDGKPQSIPEAISVSVSVPPRTSGSLAAPTTDKLISLKSLPLTPGPTKRKFESSSFKKSSRHSKRREIKLVGFGDDLPDSADSTSVLLNYREESFRKFEEARISSTTLKGQPGPVDKPGVRQSGDAMEVDAPAVPPNDAHAPAMSPRHISLYEEPIPNQLVPVVSVPAFQSPSVSSPISQPPVVPDLELAAQPSEHTAAKANSSNGMASTVFELFKEAYPEYTGDIRHFQGQCKQMIKLDQEDKMVPKWQWDDYIIRNRTDYKNYAVECLDRGENPELYHRFYKDVIRDTLYKQGVIESRDTLLEALRQLNVQPPAPESTYPSRDSPHRDKRSRASLPITFPQPKTSFKAHLDGATHDKPRYSLPAKSQRNHQTPVHNRHSTKIRTPAPAASRDATPSEQFTPRSNLLSRLSLDSAASPRASLVSGDTTPGASDRYRDFVFGYKRLTSLTGSTKVDSRMPWPRNLAVRPSIADAPKKKIDVLKWTDEL